MANAPAGCLTCVDLSVFCKRLQDESHKYYMDEDEDNYLFNPANDRSATDGGACWTSVHASSQRWSPQQLIMCCREFGYKHTTKRFTADQFIAADAKPAGKKGRTDSRPRTGSRPAGVTKKKPKPKPRAKPAAKKSAKAKARK